MNANYKSTRDSIKEVGCSSAVIAKRNLKTAQTLLGKKNSSKAHQNSVKKKSKKPNSAMNLQRKNTLNSQNFKDLEDIQDLHNYNANAKRKRKISENIQKNVDIEKSQTVEVLLEQKMDYQSKLICNKNQDIKKNLQNLQNVSEYSGDILIHIFRQEHLKQKVHLDYLNIFQREITLPMKNSIHNLFLLKYCLFNFLPS